MITITFFERLKQRRCELGLTQQEVAARIGVDTTTYAHYESGRRTPELHKLRSLCDYLGISFEEHYPIIRELTFSHVQIDKLTDTIRFVSEQMSSLKEENTTLTLAQRRKRTGELIGMLIRDTQPLQAKWDETMRTPEADLPALDEAQTLLRVFFRSEDWILLSKSLTLQSELYRLFFSQPRPKKTLE